MQEKRKRKLSIFKEKIYESFNPACSDDLLKYLMNKKL